MTQLAITMLGLVAASLGSSRSAGHWVADLAVPGALAWALAHPPSRELAITVATGFAIHAGLRAVLAMQRAAQPTPPSPAGGILRRPPPRVWSVDLDEALRMTQAPAPPRGGAHGA